MSKPPPKLEWWRVYAAVTILPINGSQKAVLGCLVDHTNPKSGLCYPSEALIAAEIKRPLRTVERAVSKLERTPYLSVKPRSQSSNSFDINFDALLKAFDAYKARGAAYRATDQEAVTAPVTETVTETVTPLLPKPKSHPSKVAGHTVKSGGSTPSKVAGKQKKIIGKEKRNSLKASPLRGDGDSASLFPPAGEVENVGGLLARFDRAFKRDPSSIPDLEGWRFWLEELRGYDYTDDPNAQRAARLAEDVYSYLDESTDAPSVGEFDNSECPF
jgi:hypothetical protein